MRTSVSASLKRQQWTTKRPYDWIQATTRPFTTWQSRNSCKKSTHQLSWTSSRRWRLTPIMRRISNLRSRSVVGLRTLWNDKDRLSSIFQRKRLGANWLILNSTFYTIFNPYHSWIRRFSLDYRSLPLFNLFLISPPIPVFTTIFIRSLSFSLSLTWSICCFSSL